MIVAKDVEEFRWFVYLQRTGRMDDDVILNNEKKGMSSSAIDLGDKLKSVWLSIAVGQTVIDAVEVAKEKEKKKQREMVRLLRKEKFYNKRK